eukprot:949269-Ditylum_brightwellii.AAC.1
MYTIVAMGAVCLIVTLLRGGTGNDLQAQIRARGFAKSSSISEEERIKMLRDAKRKRGENGDTTEMHRAHRREDRGHPRRPLPQDDNGDDEEEEEKEWRVPPGYRGGGQIPGRFPPPPIGQYGPPPPGYA